MRTSIDTLKKEVEMLNRDLGLTEGKNDYFLQGAYGGFQVQRRIPGSTAVTTLHTGFRPKREVVELIAWIRTGITLERLKVNSEL